MTRRLLGAAMPFSAALPAAWQARHTATPEVSASALCTVKLSRRLYPEADGHGLDALVARQKATGIDIPSDGETSKIGYATYIKSKTQVLFTDAEVQQSVDTILAALAREHGAVQR